MEDTKSLVTIFLQKIFHDRQHIIDTTYKLIYDYNNSDRKKAEYEKTLKNICIQLGKEIPNQVLVYLLTLVDMPLDLAESDDTQLKPVIEKIKTLEVIQKTQTCLTDTIKPHLEECVASTIETKQVVEEPIVEKAILTPKPRCRRGKRKSLMDGGSPGSTKITMHSLLDLTAMSVISHHAMLKNAYKRKFDRAWNLINTNQYQGTQLQQCYETLRDLNKKRKLLRDIENDNITMEVVTELYKDVDIFLKEKHVYEAVNADLLEYGSDE